MASITLLQVHIHKQMDKLIKLRKKTENLLCNAKYPHMSLLSCCATPLACMVWIILLMG